MIKNISKKKTFKKTLKKGGSSTKLNVGPFIPEKLSNFKKSQKEILLNEKYKPILDTAEKLRKARQDEFEKERSLLENQRKLDTQEADKHYFAKLKDNFARYKQASNIFVKLLGYLGTAIVLFLGALWKILDFILDKFLLKTVFKYLFLSIKFILSGIGTVLGWALGTVKVLFVAFYRTFLKIIVDFLRPLFEKFLEYLAKLLATLYDFLKVIGVKIFETFFGNTPWAYFLVFLVFIVLILVFVFGYVLPKTQSRSNPNNPSNLSAGGYPSTPGTSYGTLDNLQNGNRGSGSGGSGGGGGGCSMPANDKEGEHMPTYEAHKDGDYFSPENGPRNFFNNPLEFLKKFFIEGPFILIDKFFPVELQKACYCSVNGVIDAIQIIQGNPSSYDKNQISRDVLKNASGAKDGRPDNIYNIDLDNIIRPLDINIGIEDIDANKVLSLGQPKNIIWNMPSDSYLKSDYSSLPNSVKNLKDGIDKISLEDKKSVSIPWKAEGGLYVLDTENAYFTNNSNIKANIFSSIDTYFDTSINTNIPANSVNYTATRSLNPTNFGAITRIN